MKRRTFVASLIGALLATAALGGEKHPVAANAVTEGEVRKVDKDAKRITIKHGPIENLEMPAMTMVFQVNDLAMLEQVRAGDQVKFRAEKLGGAFTLVRIERAN